MAGGGRPCPSRPVTPRGCRCLRASEAKAACTTAWATGGSWLTPCRAVPRRAACAPWCVATAACLQSTAALPFGTIVIILLIWCLITIPLTVFGGIAGKNNKCVPLLRCPLLPCRLPHLWRAGRARHAARASLCAWRVPAHGAWRAHRTPPLAPRAGPSSSRPAVPTSTPARSPNCRGTAARCRRCSWRASCPSQPSTLSCTTSSPPSGDTRCGRGRGAGVVGRRARARAARTWVF